MPASHLSLSFHVIFSTKNREPWIELLWRGELHAYLGGCVRQLHAVPLEIGGMADHVHVLAGLRATHCVADVVKDVKVATSRWVHECRRLADFAWQEGYAAFTVSPSLVDGVREYIRTQAEHHRRKTFQEEYVDFLKENNVEYDERYLW